MPRGAKCNNIQGLSWHAANVNSGLSELVTGRLKQKGAVVFLQVGRGYKVGQGKEECR